ncbi:hypothetical protein BUALT_Bualt17G0096300 [Buddleja alternifolia]|uniref:Serine/threonine-protein kinase PRP4 homolog n=1 Tax=Buddleja alternifolia TaxID=168488 RepID=A0AAV6W575_9LAMI|nr:hypothetical protein BUALT_Bualt17G0096300 [Buddleja alternifolia]
MASDSSEPTRRKHRRSSSPDDAEERSKRRKHRHHRRHHRHRSSKNKEKTTVIPEEELEGGKIGGIEVEATKLENNGDDCGGAVGGVSVSSGLGFVGVNYDMEEGEIVEDDGGLVDCDNEDLGKSKKITHSDVESGEIEMNGYDHRDMEVSGENAERVDKRLRKLGNGSVDDKENCEIYHERASNSEGLANGDYPHKYHKVDDRLLYGDGKRTSDFDDEVDRRDKRKSLSSERRPRADSRSHSHDKFLKESLHGNLLKSPEWHRRNSENYDRDRSRRSDLENVSSKGNPKEKDNENLKRENDRQEDYEERISMQLVEQEEDDLEKIKEESRRRRQAILEKYKNQHEQNENQSQDTVKDQGQSSEQVASADVIPENIDSRVEGTDIFVAEPSFSVGKSPSPSGRSAFERSTGTGGGLGEGTPKSERSDDMFCDDIFGESPAGVRKTGKGDGIAVEKSGLHDNWDDAEGYYGYRFGEVLDSRYEIIAAHGKGVFSTVVRAKDLKAKTGDPEEVAIKIIRNNETMYKAGMEELVIIKKLVGADPDNKRHCVRFLSTFKYRNHLCLVFESLHMNLREVLKKFGRNIGLKLTAVRAYAKQLFIALKHLKNCGVLHSDIKPDNMLVNEAKNVLKLCDFGNAMFAGKNELTPYLVSRFYRAPEIILGLPYDHPMDIWSVGCCLFELYTGKVLFPGATNNDMLRLHMELKGPFPKKMLRKGAFTDQHFDQDLNFLATEEDPVTKKAIRRLMVNIKPKDFGTLISGSPGEDPKMVANFKDLMEKIFMLDPDKRINVSQALSHPFITGK